MVNPHTLDQTPKVSGLVLAGGQSRRMGGLDKGLQQFQGTPLAKLAWNQLGPHVADMWIVANRHLNDYAALFPQNSILQDSITGFAGPLAGMHAGLLAMEGDILVCVPCDTPNFPEDLVHRLIEPLKQRPELTLTVAQAGDRIHPVFCALRASAKLSIEYALNEGQRGVYQWLTRQSHQVVTFENPHQFTNLNTHDDLLKLQSGA